MWYIPASGVFDSKKHHVHVQNAQTQTSNIACSFYSNVGKSVNERQCRPNWICSRFITHSTTVRYHYKAQPTSSLETMLKANNSWRNTDFARCRRIFEYEKRSNVTFDLQTVNGDSEMIMVDVLLFCKNFKCFYHTCSTHSTIQSTHVCTELSRFGFIHRLYVTLKLKIANFHHSVYYTVKIN